MESPTGGSLPLLSVVCFMSGEDKVGKTFSPSTITKEESKLAIYECEVRTAKPGAAAICGVVV